MIGELLALERENEKLRAELDACSKSHQRQNIHVQEMEDENDRLQAVVGKYQAVADAAADVLGVLGIIELENKRPLASRQRLMAALEALEGDGK